MSELLNKLTASPTFIDPASGFSLDVSGMNPEPDSLAALTESRDAAGLNRLERGHHEMQRIEAGEIKNPDEQRKVTHFTDRAEYSEGSLYSSVQTMAAEIAADSDIEYAVINGIGGSALGPQMVQLAANGSNWNELADQQRRGFPRLYFLDNTDPAGLVDLLEVVELEKTLVVTISKSGGTQETKNNMTALEQAYAQAGIDFARRAAAITMKGSQLDQHAKKNNWRWIFPMAESIGGRTSETNVVGHVPAALAGLDFKSLLDGACAMDRLTRSPETDANPAYQLAVSWYLAGNGRGDRNLVVVPYSDRLALLGKYLQQLIMESLGKEHDRDGNQVCQGLTVYGNKGGTDAHAYIQQLNDGRDDFFATFIEPLEDAAHFEIEEGLSMGDYLHAFKQGLINALLNKNRKVIDIQIPRVDEYYLGMLIALHERAVAFYAELININAFHQPGVQAYKKASKEINELAQQLRDWIITLNQEFSGSAQEVAEELQLSNKASELKGLLNKMAVNQPPLAGRKVERKSESRNRWHYRIFSA